MGYTIDCLKFNVILVNNLSTHLPGTYPPHPVCTYILALNWHGAVLNCCCSLPFPLFPSLHSLPPSLFSSSLIHLCSSPADDGHLSAIISRFYSVLCTARCFESRSFVCVYYLSRCPLPLKPLTHASCEFQHGITSGGI